MTSEPRLHGTTPEGSEGGSTRKVIGAAIVVIVLVALALIVHVVTGGMAHHGLSGAHSSEERMDGGGP